VHLPQFIPVKSSRIKEGSDILYSHRLIATPKKSPSVILSYIFIYSFNLNMEELLAALQETESQFKSFQKELSVIHNHNLPNYF
jgi:hypothetical protein